VALASHSGVEPCLRLEKMLLVTRSIRCGLSLQVSGDMTRSSSRRLRGGQGADADKEEDYSLSRVSGCRSVVLMFLFGWIMDQPMDDDAKVTNVEYLEMAFGFKPGLIGKRDKSVS
jgi:hypothetical protein